MTTGTKTGGIGLVIMGAFYTGVGAVVLVGCAALGLADRTPADYAADALAAESKAHDVATRACAAYERAVVARAVKADARVSGRCAALAVR